MFLGIILPMIGIGLSLWAQSKVKNNFEKYSKVVSSSGRTGYETARKILDENGLRSVAVEKVKGDLNDHYDPQSHTVRLSEGVYDSTSVAAISVASHECGHALQHKEGYSALSIRHFLVPITNFASSAAPFLIIFGFVSGVLQFFLLGIAFFSLAVIFHLVTLPVEFNASYRAKNILFTNGVINEDEKTGVNKVLDAAALTYVAAMLASLFELVRLLLIVFSRNDK